MSIGKQKVSIMMPYLQEVAQEFGLRLNRAKEFKMARGILAVRYKTFNS